MVELVFTIAEAAETFGEEKQADFTNGLRDSLGCHEPECRVELRITAATAATAERRRQLQQYIGGIDVRDGEVDGLLVEAIITVLVSDAAAASDSAAASDASSTDGEITATASLSLASLTFEQLVSRLNELQDLTAEELSAVTTVATALAAAPVVMPNQIVALITAPPPPALPPSPYAPGVVEEFILTFTLEGRHLINPPPSAPPAPLLPPKGAEERARRRRVEDGGEGEEGEEGGDAFWRPDRVELIRHALVQSLTARQIARAAQFPNRTDLTNLPLPRLLGAGALAEAAGSASLLEVEVICDGGREHLEGMKELVEKDGYFLQEAGRLFAQMGGSFIALRLAGTPSFYTRLVAPPPPSLSPPWAPPHPPLGPPPPMPIIVVELADLPPPPPTPTLITAEGLAWWWRYLSHPVSWTLAAITLLDLLVLLANGMCRRRRAVTLALAPPRVWVQRLSPEGELHGDERGRMLAEGGKLKLAEQNEAPAASAPASAALGVRRRSKVDPSSVDGAAGIGLDGDADAAASLLQWPRSLERSLECHQPSKLIQRHPSLNSSPSKAGLILADEMQLPGSAAGSVRAGETPRGIGDDEEEVVDEQPIMSEKARGKRRMMRDAAPAPAAMRSAEAPPPPPREAIGSFAQTRLPSSQAVPRMRLSGSLSALPGHLRPLGTPPLAAPRRSASAASLRRASTPDDRTTREDAPGEGRLLRLADDGKAPAAELVTMPSVPRVPSLPKLRLQGTRAQVDPGHAAPAEGLVTPTATTPRWHRLACRAQISPGAGSDAAAPSGEGPGTPGCKGATSPRAGDGGATAHHHQQARRRRTTKERLVERQSVREGGARLAERRGSADPLASPSRSARTPPDMATRGQPAAVESPMLPQQMQSLPRFQTQLSLATIEREESDEETVEPTEQAASSQLHMLEPRPQLGSVQGPAAFRGRGSLDAPRRPPRPPPDQVAPSPRPPPSPALASPRRPFSATVRAEEQLPEPTHLPSEEPIARERRPTPPLSRPPSSRSGSAPAASPRHLAASASTPWLAPGTPGAPKRGTIRRASPPRVARVGGGTRGPPPPRAFAPVPMAREREQAEALAPAPSPPPSPPCANRAAAWSRARVGEGARGGVRMTDLALVGEVASEPGDASAACCAPPRRPPSLPAARKYVIAAEASQAVRWPGPRQSAGQASKRLANWRLKGVGRMLCRLPRPKRTPGFAADRSVQRVQGAFGAAVAVRRTARTHLSPSHPPTTYPSPHGCAPADMTPATPPFSPAAPCAHAAHMRDVHARCAAGACDAAAASLLRGTASSRLPAHLARRARASSTAARRAARPAARRWWQRPRRQRRRLAAVGGSRWRRGQRGGGGRRRRRDRVAVGSRRSGGGVGRAAGAAHRRPPRAILGARLCRRASLGRARLPCGRPSERHAAALLRVAAAPRALRGKLRRLPHLGRRLHARALLWRSRWLGCRPRPRRACRAAAAPRAALHTKVTLNPLLWGVTPASAEYSCRGSIDPLRCAALLG